jgi:hypothetical protein
MLMHNAASVRGLAALQAISRESEVNANTLAAIAALLNGKTDDELLLAAEGFNALSRHSVIIASISTTAFDIVVGDGQKVLDSMTNRFDGRPRAREERFYAASRYLKWSIQFDKVSAVLSQSLFQVGQRYEQSLGAWEGKLPDRGNGDLTARACIETMLYFNKAMKPAAPLKDRAPSEITDLLARIFGHSEDLLDRVNLTHTRGQWQTAIEGKEFSDQ